MPKESVKEADLIARLKLGNEDAFKSIYDLYARRLYAFCMEYTHSREDTEEIVQDAFLWLWKNRAYIKQETTVKNILFIRVRHFLINAWRARLNSPIFEDYLDYQNLRSDDASRDVEFDEFRQKVDSIIDELPKTQAKVVRMSRLEGYRNKEIAEKLHLSEQTVKNAVSLGLKYLKSKLFEVGLSVLMAFFICL